VRSGGATRQAGSNAPPPGDEVEGADLGHVLGVTDHEQAVGPDRLDDVDPARLDGVDPLRDRRPVELHQEVRPVGAPRARHPGPGGHLVEDIAGFHVDDVVVDTDEVRVRQQLDPGAGGSQSVERRTIAADDAAGGRVVLDLEAGDAGRGLFEAEGPCWPRQSDDRLVRHGSSRHWSARTSGPVTSQVSITGDGIRSFSCGR